MKGINIMRFRFNHNNKGFTLVEMITYIAVLAIVMVEVFVVMSNSSQFYLRGTQEVSLQTEAQEIILQMEDLLIDSTSVDHVYVPSISSDSSITISTNGVKYEIVFDKVDPSVSFGNLKLNITDGGGSGEIFMAEHVASVSVNMDNYLTNNIVTLYVKMQNQRYSYETSKDVFLRNMPGTGAKKRGKESNMKKEVGYEVFRFGDYDIQEACAQEIEDFKELRKNPDGSYPVFTYSIEWSDETKNDKDGDNKTAEDYYSITGTKISTGSTINNNLTKDYGLDGHDYKLKLYATDGSGVKTEVCELKITTPKVCVGFGGLGSDGKNTISSSGYSIIYPNTKDSSLYRSAVNVDGINMHKLYKIKATLIFIDTNDAAYENNMIICSREEEVSKSKGFTDNSVGGLDYKEFLSPGNFANTQFPKTGQNPQQCINLPAGVDKASTFQLNKIGVGTDPFSGCLLVYSDRLFNDNSKVFKEILEDGYILDVRIEATFKDGASDVVLKFDNFIYPLSPDLYGRFSDANAFDAFVSTFFTKMKAVEK